ncbi:MAG: YqcC family protein [Succinivibrio sp.]|jgi:uncharacterized protein YqcC (DUF446 family)|nr:YqcC family protein [Succinivibrio sp.]
MARTEILERLAALERQLRALGLWGGEEKRPAPEAFESAVPFFTDTMELHEWLEYVLIPRLTLLASRGDPIPRMAVYPAAQEVYRGQIRRFRGLMREILALDKAAARHGS